MFRPADYLKKAQEFGMSHLAITEHGNLNSVFEFVSLSKDTTVKPIIGIEAYFVEDKTIKSMTVDEELFDKYKKENNQKELEIVEERLSKQKMKHIILLAKNKLGYDALLESQYDSVKNGFYYKPRIDWKNLEKMVGNVIVSSACIGGIIARSVSQNQMLKAEETAIKLKDMFDKDFYFEYTALERTDTYGPTWVAMRELAKKLKIKSIITTDSHYLNKGDADLQDIVHNIGNKATMTDIKNGKAWIFDDRDLYFKDYDTVKSIMCRIFQEKDVERFLDNTNEIASKVEIYNIFPDKDILPQTDFDSVRMKKVIMDNLERKTPKEDREKYIKQLNIEWKTVKELGFLEYFWIVYDIVEWCKQNNIMTGAGRGSAGGSLLVYLLNITEVDPLKFDTSFPRFLNKNRRKMADIDVDFERDRRQEVIEYIKQKYGEDKVSQISNYVLMTDKSALKDILRIYEVPFIEATSVSKYYDEHEDVPEKYRDQFNIAKKLKDNIRNLSLHASGVLLTDKEIYKYIPMAHCKDSVVSGIDMYWLSKKKFLKVDILGLRSLDIMKRCIQYIEKYDGKKIDILNYNIEDKSILKMFQKADTNNIFQFETPMFRRLLKDAIPENFEELVELNALNRPVTIKLGMHEDYIRRKFGETYEMPKLLKKHLLKTKGILLYQEQLHKILSDILDISEGEADDIRRDSIDQGFIAATHKYENKLYLKYPKDEVDESLEILNKIADYSFNRCLTGDTIIEKQHSGDKEKITIEDLYNNTETFEGQRYYKKCKKHKFVPQLFSYDENNEKFIFNDIKDIYNKGAQEVFEIELESGEKIKATKNHRFFTNQGWKTLEEIMNSDNIEIACHGYKKSWNDGLTKENNKSLKKLSEKRIGNDHFTRKFGGKVHNQGKTKDNYEPQARTAKKLTGVKMSDEACLHMHDSAMVRDRKGSPGKRSLQACRNIGDATLRRLAAGKYPKKYTYPHKLLHEEMVRQGIWDGFENEIVVGHHSIDICSVGKKIAIQIDGDYWHASPRYLKEHNTTELNQAQKRNRQYEKACNTYLLRYGWINRRFWQYDIIHNMNEVIRQIKEIL
jgi:DNA-directed DNA polymerase III PolC